MAPSLRLESEFLFLNQWYFVDIQRAEDMWILVIICIFLFFKISRVLTFPNDQKTCEISKIYTSQSFTSKVEMMT